MFTTIAVLGLTIVLAGLVLAYGVNSSSDTPVAAPLVGHDIARNLDEVFGAILKLLEG